MSRREGGGAQGTRDLAEPQHATGYVQPEKAGGGYVRRRARPRNAMPPRTRVLTVASAPAAMSTRAASAFPSPAYQYRAVEPSWEEEMAVRE